DTAGSNALILPAQRFRDGFKIAGDDIVLDVIRLFVLPSFEKALEAAGVDHASDLAEKICGSHNLGASESVLRQQLTLQAFYPLALALLAQYEHYDLEQTPKHQTLTWAQWLGPDHAISDAVREFVSKSVSSAQGVQTQVDLGAISLSFDPATLH